MAFGTPYSTPITSSDEMQRFNKGKPTMLGDVVIWNTHATNGVRIGLYNSTTTSFKAASFNLEGDASVGFTNVNLYRLGILSTIAGAHATVEVIGVETE